MLQLDTTIEMEQLYTIDEVARMLRLHRNTVKRKIDAGELVAMQVGREYRIRESDLTAYMQSAKYRPPKKEEEPPNLQ